MSDESQVTPEPGNSTDTAQENWEQRFKDTQAAFTKSQQELADERKVWEDAQAVSRRFLEKFPEYDDEDEPAEVDEDLEPDEDDDDRPMTVAEFKAYQREQAETQKQQTAQQQYEADFQKFTNGRELSKLGERAIRAAPAKTPEELKAAVDEWFEHEDARAPKQKPRVPHVPTNGSAATDVPNWDDMTQGEINQYMAEKVRGHQAQT